MSSLRYYCLSLFFLSASLHVEASTPASPFVIVVGNNHSFKASLKKLKYAQDDASRMAEALQKVGHINPERLILLQGNSLHEFQETVDQFLFKIKRESGEELSKFIFYYSGHSDESGLHFKDGLLAKDDFHNFLEATPARTKVVIIDGCFSGALAVKGINKSEPFETPKFQFDEPSGTVFLSASSSDEFAYESETYQGSLFTHNLVSGLYGKADGNLDDVVTAWELYQYAFRQTRLQSLTSPSGGQNPEFSTRLAGKGAVALAIPSYGYGSLQFNDDISGEVVISSRKGQHYTSFKKRSGKSKSIQLPIGSYNLFVKNEKGFGSKNIEVQPGQEQKIQRKQIVWNQRNHSEVAKGSRLERSLEIAPKTDNHLSFPRPYFMLGVREELLESFTHIQIGLRKTKHRLAYQLSFGFDQSGDPNMRRNMVMSGLRFHPHFLNSTIILEGQFGVSFASWDSGLLGARGVGSLGVSHRIGGEFIPNLRVQGYLVGIANLADLSSIVGVTYSL